MDFLDLGLATLWKNFWDPLGVIVPIWEWILAGVVVQAELLSQFLYEVLIPDIMIKWAIFEEVLSLRADLADVDTIELDGTKWFKIFGIIIFVISATNLSHSGQSVC